MRPIQNIFHSADYPDLLVGLDDPDDAAVWRISADRGLIVTTDFFTPVVDDPYDYGSIAATNALSDVYAMGGQPFLALNIAALPPDLPAEVSAEILRGGAEKALQAGVVVAGGHTVQDKEPKYGLVVLGFVDPNKMVTKKGARPGDVLVLSKPLGFGTVTTALRGEAAPADVEEVVRWMTRLNRDAARAANAVGVRGGTDITGFGLLGHAGEIATASKVGLKFNFSQIPFVSSARRYADEWIFPGGSHDNRHYFSPHVKFAQGIDEPSQMLLFDAQTSGGLLLSVPADMISDFERSAAELEQPVWVVGEVIQGSGITIS